MTAYYNEIDRNAAAWLRELIKRGLIADGEVDERSIEKVRPEDLRGFRQCHFFAGIGVWSYALRRAGWPDEVAVWTGSCPCQSFSASGSRGGFSDKRHLWPAWFRLIRELKPVTVFGEQVASKDGLAWFDVVSSDLESEAYAVGAADICAAGVGAPHIRQRLYFVADTEISNRGSGERGKKEAIGPNGIRRRRFASRSPIDELADTERRRFRELRKPSECNGQSDGSGGMGDSSREGLSPCEPRYLSGTGRQFERRAGTESSQASCGLDDTQSDGRRSGGNDHGEYERIVSDAAGFTNGFWRDPEWIYCTGGKWRPIEPGSFPLAHGAAKRVGRLRCYGNAIVAPCAQAFIESFIGEEGFAITE